MNHKLLLVWLCLCYFVHITESRYMFLASASLRQSRDLRKLSRRSSPAGSAVQMAGWRRRKEEAPTPVVASEPEDPPALTYADLTPLGKVVAGSVEVAIATTLEYISGFMGGYALGTITGIPRLLFTSINGEQRQLWQEALPRLTRMHQKSFSWASTWGGISAAFGGFRVATKIVRGGVEDEWSTVFSSMAAGAFFARASGANGMIQGAVMYGGLTYLLSGGLRLKKSPTEYKEEVVVDF